MQAGASRTRGSESETDVAAPSGAPPPAGGPTSVIGPTPVIDITQPMPWLDELTDDEEDDQDALCEMVLGCVRTSCMAFKSIGQARKSVNPDEAQARLL